MTNGTQTTRQDITQRLQERCHHMEAALKAAAIHCQQSTAAIHSEPNSSRQDKTQSLNPAAESFQDNKTQQATRPGLEQGNSERNQGNS